MGWARSFVLVTIAAGLLACGDGRDDRAPALLALGEELLRNAAVQPVPGAAGADPSVVRVKNAPTYVVATGLLPLPRDEARRAVEDAVRRAGFDPRTPVADTVVSTRDDVVAELSLYGRLGELEAPPGSTLVQLRLAHRDTRLEWTQV